MPRGKPTHTTRRSFVRASGLSKSTVQRYFGLSGLRRQMPRNVSPPRRFGYTPKRWVNHACQERCEALGEESAIAPRRVARQSLRAGAYRSERDRSYREDKNAGSPLEVPDLGTGTVSHVPSPVMLSYAACVPG